MMTQADIGSSAGPPPGASLGSGRLARALKTAGPPLLFGLRLWASVCLALYVAFWLELDHAFWAGTSAAIVCQPHLGASLRKGWYRMIGTVIGGVAIVLLTACFPQDRVLFLVALALWGAACALLATLLRNFAAYAAALAGYTAAIIASDQLGATGGLNGQAFMLAMTRVSEICIGIVAAGVVLAATDLGAARRRLAGLFADIGAEISGRFMNTLVLAGPGLPDTRPVRRELVRRVVGLDPVIDEAIGESTELRYHSPQMQDAVDGLLAALAGWRTLASHLEALRDAQARLEADIVLRTLSLELQSKLALGEPTSRWIEDPIGLRKDCEEARQRLTALRTATPSLRLLADRTAEVLAGMASALDGAALLLAPHAQPRPRADGVRLRIPDWLPSFVNAGRAFAVIIAAALFWIITEWPSGAETMAFAAIAVILFAPRADQAYATTQGVTLGAGIGAVLAAVVAFALLPNFETFAALGIGLGLVLVPTGAGMTQSWQTATFTGLATWFVPLVGPANQMSYNTIQFYNSAVAIVAGIGVAALAFRLLPPLSPAFRTRRLMELSLRDFRRLATGEIASSIGDWQSRIYGRFSVLPDEARPLQRSELLAALSGGTEIIKLRSIASRLDLMPELDAALEAVARGNGAAAIARLADLDRVAASFPGASALQARAGILAVSEALARHAAYFDEGAPSEVLRD
jgi:uncharacterized membrane protein YccC